MGSKREILLVVRCSEIPAAGSTIVRCGTCREKCWIHPTSPITGEYVCHECLPALLDSIEQAGGSIEPTMTEEMLEAAIRFAEKGTIH